MTESLHEPWCCLHPESACAKAGGCSSSCNCGAGTASARDGGFWADLGSELRDREFRQAYVRESLRIGALDEEANRLGRRIGRLERAWRGWWYRAGRCVPFDDRFGLCMRRREWSGRCARHVRQALNDGEQA